MMRNENGGKDRIDSFFCLLCVCAKLRCPKYRSDAGGSELGNTSRQM